MVKSPLPQHLPLLIAETLQELSAVLKQLPSGFYGQSLPLLEGNSVGMHVRHMIEFFECLIKQVPEGNIDYDLRERQKHIEEDRQMALAAIENIRTHLMGITEDKPLQLKALVLPDVEKITVPSTLFRELVYNLEHVIHHAALIRVAILHYCPEVSLPAHFGLAPSTLKSRQYS
ncbi:hypothetical protein [Thermonema rossianum]|uniref:hypothetical protein n=1 Tax=Thermonema rossianum TaxID=55505 RepID=UPI00068C4A27|nr:hypothetical protein [Thermonema rossianum]